MGNEANVNKVFESLGARLADAHNAAVNVPVNTGQGAGLPDGVRGIALLTSMEFVEGKKADDKGKYYFMAKANVMSPKDHEGIKCAGKMFNKLIPMFDTPKRKFKKTFLPNNEGVGHWIDIRDLLASFGVQSPPPQQPGEAKEATGKRLGQWLVAAMDVLTKQAKDPDPIKRPHFEFHTWKGEKATEGDYKGKEPMVTVFWDGRTEWSPPVTDPAAGVGPAPSTNGQHAVPPASPPPAQPSAALPTPPPAAPPPPPVEQPVAPPATDAQLDAWAEAADSDPDMATDEANQGKDGISLACSELGITSDETRPLADWKAVVALVKARRSPQAAPAAATATPSANGQVPAKGQQVQYKGQACEVTSVAADVRKVTLKVVGGKSVTGPDTKLLKVDFSELS